MSRYISFLTDSSGKSPKNLKDSIRKIQNASAGFRDSWLVGKFDEAGETSNEAFEHLDYLQNELLRQRDIQKSNQLTWPNSPLNAALSEKVGTICNNVSSTQTTFFAKLSIGSGQMPPNANSGDLTLGTALNKLKHRNSIAVNFALPTSGGHILYILTSAGMGQPESLCEIDIKAFCDKCKNAALHV